LVATADRIDTRIGSGFVVRDAIKVLIVDDHPVFRDGLRQCLEARKTVRVLATAGGGDQMWRAFRAHGRPQIVLMDVELPGEGGIELTRTLHEKHPEIRVVMLTAYSDSERVFAALKAGAVGYLLKNVSPDEIRATVERAAAGEPMLSGEIAGRVLREFERERAEERFREQLDALTAREEEILKLLATGESNREIGKRLFISEQTVKNHVASIFRKLQVNDRTKAALLAVKLGLGDKQRP
jgi:NarL family two-component system response regulator LiaR